MTSPDNIYILGAHKLATSYLKKLIRAQINKELNGKNISCIPESPATFIIDYFASPNKQNPADVLVPDHTAKHVMLQVFMEFAKKNLPQAKVELCSLTADFQTPFLHKSDHEALWAMSYATWTCPPDCDEPAVCPHIQDTRTWDFFESLPKFLETAKTLIYCYGCKSLFKEISYIPLQKICKDLKDFENKLKKLKIKNVIVATHSHCHGILGQFEIKT